MILPDNITDNISYSTETQIFLCEPCRDCFGSGNDQDISSSVNPTKPYQDKGCKKWWPRLDAALHHVREPGRGHRTTPFRALHREAA